MPGAGPHDAGSAGDEEKRGNEGADEERQRAALVAAARERFVALVRRPERDISLAEAALLIAAEEFPRLDIPHYLGMLDTLAHRVGRRLAESSEEGAHDADERALAALDHVLFEEEGFSGPPEAAWEHEDFFLSGGLERKRGVPIVLSVIYCEVAARAGLQAVGVNLPSHFMAQFRGEHLSVLVDPFNHGARIPPDTQPMGYAQDRLPIASRKQTLARMLQNLKFLYVQSRPPQLLKALAAVERILLLVQSPDQLVVQLRDRGLILRGLGANAIERARILRRTDPGAAAHAISRAGQFFGPAWFDLKLYARLAEGAQDAAQTGELADQLWRELGRQN
jgi:regulator of sirC expression with transglutaminase-like and TPR domain